MIYNGKWVQPDPKSAAVTQTEINKNNFMQQDLKSEIPRPKSVVDGLTTDGLSLEYGFGSFAGAAQQPYDKKTVYSLYSEMSNMEFINKGLSIIASDGSKKNTQDNVFKIYSENEDIKEKLNDLFFNRLDMNNDLYNIIYETVKMGDNYYEIIPDSYEKPTKIIYIRYLDPRKVGRIEANGRLSHFEYTVENEKDAKMVTNSNTIQEIVYKLQPWQIIHFRIPDKESEPYGGSLLKPGVSTYRKLALLEDIVLVYTLARAPERRIFYIDVGNMNTADAKRYLSRIKDEYRSKPLLDEDGNYNKRTNVLSITSDVFVPTRPDGNNATKIDTLPAGQGLAGIEDFLKYFKDKILKCMNIPLAYLDASADHSRGSAASGDQMFGAFIERIQAHITVGLNKIATLELLFGGFKKEQLTNFNLKLTSPSNINEISNIEIMNQRFSLLQTIQSLNLFSNKWMLKNVMKMTDKEITDESLNKTLELQAAAGSQPAEGGMGGGGGIGMGGMGDMGLGAGAPPPMPGEPGAIPPVPGQEGAVPPIPGQVGTPPLLPGEPGTPPPPTPGPENADTFINMLGRDFLIENKDDFFSLVKTAEDYKKNIEAYKNTPKTVIPLIEAASDFIRGIEDNKKAMIIETTKNITKQFILNEIGGFKLEKEGIIFEMFDQEDGSILELEVIEYKEILSEG